ncbi:MAG: citrate/2-methylcitrate synthase [Candidatus Omnitrophica bacterium]|nr:citrate/2-methylcitrate synthase [Candidatus Omnitrophota bacterium]MDD5081444.1 citrate/2-methylcitrate synthase [Candidatus Omnitrophota bacterium]MDD5440809.1 citrate/2-methylcitrate synthase [Candidatus Omnitrophota bacterium]
MRDNIKKRNDKTKTITKLILEAKQLAHAETDNINDAPIAKFPQWPINCVVGPGLEGAIACESKIGYVNGAKGLLIYRGYDIFDLCAYSSYEEVSYLLLYGKLPTANQLDKFSKKLISCRKVSDTIRLLFGFPIGKMNPMAALRLGTTLMRCEFTSDDLASGKVDISGIIHTDADSIPMETLPIGEQHAIYEFHQELKKGKIDKKTLLESANSEVACHRLIAGCASLTASISRMRQDKFPLEPREDLSHAANFLYMMTGKVPTAEQERIMDVSLILHADHGMNASTFASMVVASTLSDIYLSVGSGIAALNGPLHGGANEQVINMLKSIGSPDNVKKWYERACSKKQKVMGFGHRVYKAYDPRARILGPLANYLVSKSDSDEVKNLFKTAKVLEKEVLETLGKEKKIFPNVDFYSGIVYHVLGISPEIFTPLFAVSRVAGWTARIIEYLKNNRIFRPRAIYSGPLDKNYVNIEDR